MIESTCFPDNYWDTVWDWLQAVFREEAWWWCAVKVAEINCSLQNLDPNMSCVFPCFSFLLPTWVEFPVVSPSFAFFLAEKDHFGPWPSLPVPGSAAWWREGNPGVVICSGLRGTSIYLLSLDARITMGMPHDSWHTYIVIIYIYIGMLDC